MSNTNYFKLNLMKTIALTLLSLLPLLSTAQDTLPSPTVKRNTVYVEAFGQGIYNSLSYDRLYRTNHKIKTSVNAGITLVPITDYFVVATPVAYNFLFGKKSHHLELGLGFTAMYTKAKLDWSRIVFDDFSDQSPSSLLDYYRGYSYYISPKIGYRFQQAKGGFFMVVNFTPSISTKYYRNDISNLLDFKLNSIYTNKFQYNFFPTVQNYKTPSFGLSLGYTF
jgi:hypothetical protein